LIRRASLQRTRGARDIRLSACRTLITIYGAGVLSRHSLEEGNPISLGRTNAQYGLDPRRALGGDKTAEETLWNTAVGLVQTLRLKNINITVGDPQWSQPKKFRGKFRLTITIKAPHGQDPHFLVQYLPTGFQPKSDEYDLQNSQRAGKSIARQSQALTPTN